MNVVEFIRAHRALAKSLGRRAVPLKRVAAPAQPRAIELAYASKLLDMLRPVHAAVVAHVYPVVRDHLEGQRKDAPSDDAKRALASIRIGVRNSFSDSNVRPTVESIAIRTSDFQRSQMLATMKKMIGVEVPIREAPLAEKVAAFTAENVGLIQSIPEQYLDLVQARILRGMAGGERWEPIAKYLERRYDVTKDRATLIAKDQVLKFHAGLHEARQKALGITHFYWRTDNDERVCEVCAPLDGKRFTWANAPGGGPSQIHPLCRCNAEPDVKGLLDRL